MFSVMSVSESRRHDLYNGLNELLGAERADTLMEYLPTDTNLATQGDLLNLETRLGARMDRLETTMGELRAEVKDSLADLSAELKADQDDLKADVTGSISELKAEFKESRREFSQRLDRVFLALVTGLFAITATFIAAVFIV